MRLRLWLTGNLLDSFIFFSFVFLDIIDIPKWLFEVWFLMENCKGDGGICSVVLEYSNKSKKKCTQPVQFDVQQQGRRREK